jgi:transposase
MGHLRNEERTAMSVLLEQGHSQSAVARLLGVSEGTVRYHPQAHDRWSAGRPEQAGSEGGGLFGRD